MPERRVYKIQNSNFEDYNNIDETYIKFIISNKDDEISATGGHLEKITEGTNTGYRLKDKDPAHYGDIGSNAVDLSISLSSSTNLGATGLRSFAEGSQTKASGDWSHAEGETTEASGNYSHAEGRNTLASGDWSHAEGVSTIASGAISHASGQETITRAVGETAIGRYNTDYTPDGDNDRAFVVGTGNTNTEREDSFTVFFNGTAKLKGFKTVELPSASAQEGQMAYVTDAYTPTYRGKLPSTGSGREIALVFYDGTDWIYH